MNKILIALISLILFSCNPQKKECTKFKTGTFKYLDENSKHITITRNDTLQIENNIKNNIKITTSVKWESDCSYTLKYEDVTNYEYRNDILGKKIFISIIETKGNIYTARVKSSTTNTIVKMRKIQ